jgi:hypothetical protein
LWRFQFNTSTWSQLVGSSSINAQGVYNNIGDAENAAFYPGARIQPTVVVNEVTRLVYVFGGECRFFQIVLTNMILVFNVCS